jgi:hypothetical protein
MNCIAIPSFIPTTCRIVCHLDSFERMILACGCDGKCSILPGPKPIIMAVVMALGVAVIGLGLAKLIFRRRKKKE